MTAVVSADGNSVQFREEMQKHVDKFAGVAGEIEFCCLDNSLLSVEVTFTDGSTASATTPRVATGGKTIASLTTRHAALGRRWAFQWQVGSRAAPPRPDAVPEFARAVERASRVVLNAPVARGARIDAARQVADILKPHAADVPEAANTVAVLRLLLERENLVKDPELQSAIAKILAAADHATTKEGWRKLQNELYKRATHFATLLGQGKIATDDATRLLNVVKYGAIAADDLRNPMPGGDGSPVTKFLKTAYGATAVMHGTAKGDARVIVDGIRDLVDQLPGMDKSPVTGVLDVPTEVVAATLNVTRRGFDETTSALDNVAAAIGGDPAALDRAIEHSRNVELVLSGERYGRAMLDAINDRIIDKIPFARTLVTWFNSE